MDGNNFPKHKVIVPTRRARCYTQVSARRRHFGRDAGTQAQGGDASCYPNL